MVRFRDSQMAVIGFISGLALIWALAGCSPSTDTQQPLPERALREPAAGADRLPDKFAPQGSFYPILTTASDRLAHRRGCPRLETADPAGREYFRAYAPARAKGYRACPQCRPDAPR